MQQIVMPIRQLRAYLTYLINKEGGDPMCEVLTDEETGVFLVSLTLPMAEALANIQPVPLCHEPSRN